LKAKADDFLRSGDIRSACSAYTAALDVDNHIVSCRSNRSICYLKLHQFHDCVDDCSVTIHQINEEMEADGITTEKESILKKALMRRGLCYCCLGRFEDALKDYKEALIFVKVRRILSVNCASYP
jgi:tetratricopeptide (TPR) repeat protein